MLATIVLVFVAVVTLGLVLTVVMHVFLHVPYVGTPPKVARRMVELARLTGRERVVDLGAGDGRVLFAAKRMHPGITAVGCEIVPTVWCLGVIRKLFERLPVTLQLKSALAEDLRSTDVLLLYVTPPLMNKLLPKFERELRPGTRIVSHAFHVPGKIPQEKVEVERPWGKAMLYAYVW